MAYSRLMRVYYRTEKPIPTDLKAACRLVRAQSKPQRDAVETVLKEFFEPQADGWCNKRCDKEIAAANTQAEINKRIAAEREAKRSRTDHDSSNEASTKRATNRSPATSGEREPIQTPDSKTPDSTSQTPDTHTPNQGLQSRSRLNGTHGPEPEAGGVCVEKDLPEGKPRAQH